MYLTDEIRNYEVTTALPIEKIKTSREYYALAVLKYSFPEQFAGLRKGETPDLQDVDRNIGVEVTWGGSPRDEIINGESYKFSHAKSDNDRKKCLQRIKENGGDRNEYSISYPVSTSDGDKKHIQNVLTKKLKKIDSYRVRVNRIGLAILIDIPLLFFDDPQWGDWLSPINKGSFDFIALVHWSGIDMYDFKMEEYISFRIEREDMDALKKLGRMTAEGIIKDDDPVWW